MKYVNTYVLMFPGPIHNTLGNIAIGRLLMHRAQPADNKVQIIKIQQCTFTESNKMCIKEHCRFSLNI